MKLLIVDDDIYTREGLAETIPWNLYGIDDVRHCILCPGICRI